VWDAVDADLLAGRWNVIVLWERSRTEKRLRRERDEARERAQRAEAAATRPQRSEVERLAAEALRQPGDFWLLAGEDIAPWIADDGDVDADAVRARAAEEAGKRPGMAGVVRRRDPDQGDGDSATRTPTIRDWLRQAPC